MSSLVVKLGSSIVADERGDARLDVLGRICDELAALHRAGHDAGRRHQRRDRPRDGGDAADPTRPDPVGRARRSTSCRRRSAVGQGKLYQVYDELLRARGVTQRPGAADVLRHERPDALPQRSPDAAQAAGLARRPDHQRERHDHDRRDLVRQQRLPRGPGGDPAVGRAAGAADRRRGRVHRRPAGRPRRPRWSSESTDFGALDALDIGHATSPLGTGGMRSKVVAAEMATAAGMPVVIAGGLTPGTITRAAAGRAGRHALPRPRGALLELQAVAEVRQAGARAGARRRRRRAGAARRRHEPAAGRDRRRQRQLRRRRRGRDRCTMPTPVGKGICNYSADELRQVRGLQSRGGPRAAAAGLRGGDPPRLLRARVNDRDVRHRAA